VSDIGTLADKDVAGSALVVAFALSVKHWSRSASPICSAPRRQSLAGEQLDGLEHEAGARPQL
jgi:hypothetical protein